MQAGLGTTNSSGTFTYQKSGPDSALFTSWDALAGNLSGQLFFTSPTAGCYYNTNSSGTQSGTFTMVDGAPIFLGHAKISPDAARAGSVYFAADGNPVSLSVTNQSGQVWTLSVPADALLMPVTITMTPSAGVDASQSLFPILASVQLDPDGTQFVDPPTLTVTAPGPLNTHATLLMGGHDGRDLCLVPTTNQAGVFSMPVWHFSSTSVGNPSDSQWQNLVNQAQNAYNSLVDAVNSVINKASRQHPPLPPNVTMTCKDDGQSGISQFVYSMESSLDILVSQLRAVTVLIAALGSGEAVLENQLLQAYDDGPVQELVNTYQGDPLKFFSVASVVNAIAARGGPALPPAISPALKHWAKDTYDFYLFKLTEQHDYTMIQIFPKVFDRVSLAAPGVVAPGKYITDFNNAQVFSVTLDIDMAGAITEETESMAGGFTTVQSLAFPLHASGTMNYDAGFGPTGSGYALVLPESYPLQVDLLSIDACQNKQLTFAIDRFGAGSETWSSMGHAVTIPGYLQTYAPAAFNGNVIKGGSNDGWYSFTAHLQNRNETAVEDSFSQTAGASGEQVTIHVTIEHTPQ